MKKQYEYLPKGEKHYTAKLTEKDVREIRKRYLEGERVCDLAREFEIHPTSLRAIITYRSWKHVD